MSRAGTRLCPVRCGAAAPGGADVGDLPGRDDLVEFEDAGDHQSGCLQDELAARGDTRLAQRLDVIADLLARPSVADRPPPDCYGALRRVRLLLARPAGQLIARLACAAPEVSAAPGAG
jgi:hypothetical protein